MTDSIQFSAWASPSQMPDACSLCTAERSLFDYAILTDPLVSGGSRELRGHCCLRCGQQLLTSIAEVIIANLARPPTSADNAEKTLTKSITDPQEICPKCDDPSGIA